MNTLRRRTGPARIIVAALLTAVLAACSAPTPSQAPAPPPATAAGSLAVGAVSAGGAPAADPHGQLFSESDWARLTAIYDTITVRGEDGAAAPGLATSWVASKDASEWTFTLRADATFSDGTRVTASDALYSLGRMQEKAAENGGRGGALDMAKSRAVDDTTLVLATRAPDAELPLALTLGSFVVKAGTTDFTKPVGSGAFVQESLHDQAALLAASPHWWGGKPGVAKLEIRGFSDPAAMAQAVVGGSIDMAIGVQPAAAKANQGGDIHVAARPGGESVPLLMRVDTKPFDDRRVRDAVKLALDRTALVEQVYLGFGTPGRDMIRLTDRDVPGDVGEVERDVQRAKQLLAEAGYPQGFTTTLHTSSAYPAMIPLATAAKEQLADVGITVEITEHAPDQYWTKAYGVAPFTVGLYVSTQTFGALVRATMLSSAAYSETGWKDAEFDATYAKAMATTDDAARAQLIAGLHRRMAAEGGWLVWGFGDRLTLYRGHVRGVSEVGNPYDVTGITVGG